MWICSNCETANDGRKKKCAVCDVDRIILEDDINTRPTLKNKLIELETQISNLRKIINDENIKYIRLNTEFVNQRNQLKAVENLLTDSRRNLNISDVQRRELRNNLSVKTNELNNLKSTYNIIQKDLENSREYVGKLELEKRNFERKMLDKDNEIKLLNEKYISKTKNADSLFIICIIILIILLVSYFGIKP
jgi:chromosome segregation ATPase